MSISAAGQLKLLLNTAVVATTSTPQRGRTVSTMIMTTPYRDNASRILPITLNTSSSSSKNNENDTMQIRQVAAALCPSLVVNNRMEQPHDNQKSGIDDISDGSSNTELLDNTTMKEQALLLKNLKVKALEGGLSNELFVVENDQTNLSVLVRIHPSNHPKYEIVDRQAENRLVAWLSSSNRSSNCTNSGVGAPLFYGRFQNGRVEEFYKNHVPLSHKEMVVYGPEIARLLARLHNQTVPDHVGLPRKKNNNNGAQVGFIWDQIQQWLDMAEDAVSNQSLSSSSSLEDEEPHDEENAAAAHQLLSEFKQEWTWLKSVLMEAETGAVLPEENESSSSSSFSSSSSSSSLVAQARRAAKSFGTQIVLTHMDAQPLNFLRPADTTTTTTTTTTTLDSTKRGTLRMIDYEYAGFNARAADIANTFCEHCDNDKHCADYEAEYPSEEVQNAFLRAYLAETRIEPHDSSPIMTTMAMAGTSSTVTEEQEEFLAALRELIGKYTLVSHLGWAIWSLVQHRVSNIPFDYIAYAQYRMQGYRYFQQRYWGSISTTTTTSES